jgi:hypothetical protein
VKRPPTDFELLRAIYERHKSDYEARAAAGGLGRIFVPLDIPAIATDLGTDENMVFGRLYHHLEEIHGQKRDPTNPHPRKTFFTPRIGPDDAVLVNAINFPLMEAVLASHWQERDRDRRTFWISVVSIGIAITSLVLSGLLATGVIAWSKIRAR